MNICKYLKGIIMIMPLFFVSCNQDMKNSLGSDKTRVFFSMDDFENVKQSRTTIHPDKKYSVTWAKGDVIGIFPYEGYQEPFEIPDNQANSGTATFDGGYWDLKDGLKYNAYYPFDKVNFDSPDMKTKIPVSYEGQKQIGASCCVGSHAFTYSDWATAGDGSVYFQFHHIGSLVVITLPIPATTTYSCLTIEAEDAIIPITGTYDLTAKLTKNEEPSFVANASSLSKSISVKLVDFAGTANTNAIIYMMLPPVDLSSKTLTLTLKATEEGSCVYSVAGKNVQKGKKTEFIGEPKESNVYGTIDGWIDDDNVGDAEEDVISAKSVTLTTAGTLSTLISDEEKDEITSLTISGPLNGDDILFLRSIGSQYKSKLKNLNLSNASIVEGGSAYFSNYMTENNVIGLSMFSAFKLQELILPLNITTIKAEAFSNCSNLKSLVIPDGVTTLLGGGIFHNVKISFTLPESVTEISSPAFVNNRFTSIVVEEGNIKYDSRNGCNAVIETNTNTLVGGCKETIIPNTVTKIGMYAFAGCDMTTITIPGTITAIEGYAFTDCQYLKNIHCKATNPPTLNNIAFNSEIFTNCTLYVPTGSKNAYSTNDNWKQFTNIEEE